jgi:hypothetical protein
MLNGSNQTKLSRLPALCRSTVAVAGIACSVLSGTVHGGFYYKYIDFNYSGLPDTQPGFTDFPVNDGAQTASIGLGDGVALHISNIDADYIGAKHGTMPTDAAGLTTSALYRDCIYAYDKSGQPGEPPLGTPRGLDVTLTGLTPNALYEVEAWSWNTSPFPDSRASEWTLIGTTSDSLQFTFDGSVVPSSDTDNTFKLVAEATGSGSLLLEGRRLDSSVNASSENSHGVYLNAVSVTLVPEPSSVAVLVGFLSSVLALRERWGAGIL